MNNGGIKKNNLLEEPGFSEEFFLSLNSKSIIIRLSDVFLESITIVFLVITFY